MSAFQLTTFIGIPLTVLVVAVVLVTIARPDRDPSDGVYAAYLALAGVLSLYILLLALAALGESVVARIVIGDGGGSLDPSAADQALAFRSYFSLTSGDAGPTIAAFATLSVLMAAAYGFHARLRTELAGTVGRRGVVERVDVAYRSANCFSMVVLVIVAAIVAGANGYTFFANDVTNDDRVRDLAMGSLLVYGGLVLIAGLLFRAFLSPLRGNDELPEGPEPVEMDEA